MESILYEYVYDDKHKYENFRKIPGHRGIIGNRNRAHTTKQAIYPTKYEYSSGSRATFRIL